MPIVFGDFTLDELRRQLLRNGEPAHLSPKVFQLLSILAGESPRAVTKADLQDRLWPGTFVTEGSISTLVAELRSALGDDAHEPKYIRTLYGFGYAFTASVHEVAPTPKLSRKPGFGHLTSAAAFGAVAVVLLLALRSTTRLAPPPSSQPIRSIAVLPFDTSGADRGDQHLGVGLADLLITRLTNVRQVIVRPTSAIREFAGHRGDSPEIGRKLNVDAVLEGSIRTTPERIRVTVQLLNVHEREPIWADHFDVKRADMFAIEDNISERVADALAVRLTPNEKKLLAKRYTANPEAYALYIQGRYQNDQVRRSLASFGRERAADLLKKAVEKDPSYALAWAALAGAYAGSAWFGETGPRIAYPKAQAAAERALQLDNSLSEAHMAAGWLRSAWYLDFAGAERELQRALELNPRNTGALNFYGHLLMDVGRFDESLALRRREIELDPLNPAVQWGLAVTYLTARQDDRGIQQALLVLKMDPNFSEAHIGLARVYTLRGEYDKAIAEAREAMRIGSGGSRGLAFLGYALGMSGNKAEARKILEQLTTQQNQPPFLLAIVNVGLGDRDAVFPLLEKAVDDRSQNVALRLKTEPIWEPLRSDPRFQALLRRAHFSG